MNTLRRPTLLSINNYYYRRGGAEVVFLEHNRLFENEGWRAVPFSMRHPKNESSPWDSYFVDEIEFASDYSWMEKIRKAPKALYSFEARRKVARLMDEIYPDVCHAHNIYHHLSPAILPVIAARGIPLFLTLHDLKIACPAYLMLSHEEVCERCKGGKLYEVALNRCLKGSLALSTLVMLEAYLHDRLGSYRKHVTRFVVPSSFYIEKFIEWGFDPAKFVHIPNFVDCALFEPRFKAGKRFVYFGRLSREKGVGTLMKAAGRAGVGLDIVGTGPLEPELRALSETLNSEARFHGFLSGRSLHSVVREARAVVLPSEWYENAPISVLEAYALGKPVIGSSLGGISELIVEGETGSIFTAGDIDDLAAVLEAYAMKSEADIAEMGGAGLELVGTEYSPARYVERNRTLYAAYGVAA